MKTIRQNVFETNSSSSHSIVIGKHEIQGDIEIINGVLNVSDLEQFVVSSNGYSDCEIILCDTKNKKLALAFAIILNKQEWDNEKYFKLEEQLKTQYNITEVIGEYGRAWDDEGGLEELINVIDTDIPVQSIYESN